MSLKRAGLIATASGTNELILRAEANESYLIRRIDYFAPAAAAEDFSITVDRRTVNQYVAPATWGVGLKVPSSGLGSLVDALFDRNLLKPIPVASGQTLNCTAPGTNNFVQVVYDLYDADDIKATMFNGTETNDFQLFQVVSNSGSLSSAGDAALNRSDLDSQFPAFPGGEVAQANRRFELLALFGAPVAEGNGSANHHFSTFLKMIQDRKDILDQSLVGMLFQGDSGHTANSTGYGALAGLIDRPRDTNGGSLYVFDTPLTFEGGSELNVIVSIATGSAGVELAAGDAKLGLLFNIFGT